MLGCVRVWWGPAGQVGVDLAAGADEWQPDFFTAPHVRCVGISHMSLATHPTERNGEALALPLALNMWGVGGRWVVGSEGGMGALTEGPHVTSVTMAVNAKSNITHVIHSWCSNSNLTSGGGHSKICTCMYAHM